MLWIMQSIIGAIGILSFIFCASLFRRRSERKHLILFGIGSLILIIVGLI